MKELAPEQHSRIRRQLALIPVYIWLLYGWADLVVSLPRGFASFDGPVTRDFVQFYIPGVLANERNAGALYDIDAWPAIAARVVPEVSSARYPPVYGPQISVFFSPLAQLPYVPAMLLWMLISLFVYLACGHLLWQACPRLHGRRATTALVLLAAPGLHFMLTFAQISAIALVCVTAAYFALRANRRFLAGLAIGSLAYKPQLGLVFAFVFVFAAEWRIVAGTVLAAALQFAAADAFWGLSILRDYARTFARLIPSIPTDFEPFRFQMHSWLSFFDLLGLPQRAALALYAAAAFITAAGALACWRTRAPLAVRYSVLLIATVLVNPHMYVYDFVVLTPAFLLLADWAIDLRNRRAAEVFAFPTRRFNRVSAGALVLGLMYFCYLSPLMSTLARSFGIQLSVPALFLLGLTVGTVVHHERHRPDQSFARGSVVP